MGMTSSKLRAFLVFGAGAGFALVSIEAAATYSIVAVDETTGAIGGAGASCVGSLNVGVIYASAPGRAALHAQARLQTRTREEGQRLLELGRTPAEVIAALTRAETDREFERRQYSVVARGVASQTFTGAQNSPWAGGRTGAWEGFRYAIAGNIISSERVLTQAERGFTAPECDLAARLMGALVQGQANGEGDERCLSRGTPADSSFVRVEAPDGRKLLDLSVVDTGRENAVLRLQAAYEAWRRRNACPESPDAGGLAPDAGDEPSTPEAPNPDASASGPLPTVGSGACTCVASPTTITSPWAGLFALLLVRPRRKRHHYSP